MATLRLTPGMTVKVKSIAEIAHTLDDKGRLDNLPFMPEMVQFCGKKFVVAVKMDTTCVEGHGARRFHEDVFILQGVRCDGSAHHGCPASCAIFWKESWLTLDLEEPITLKETFPNLNAFIGGKPFCQATELHKATIRITPLSLLLKMLKQAVLGRTTLARILRDFSKDISSRFSKDRPTKTLSKVLSREPKTPLISLGLRRGDIVRVKTESEIRATLDKQDRNRGLRFTPPMLPYCGGVYRVRDRLDNVIVERIGEMTKIPNTVILEDVVCRGLVKCVECPRAQYLWWREAWLEKIESEND